MRRRINGKTINKTCQKNPFEMFEKMGAGGMYAAAIKKRVNPYFIMYTKWLQSNKQMTEFLLLDSETEMYGQKSVE